VLQQKIVSPPQRVSENKGLVISAVNAVQKISVDDVFCKNCVQKQQ
jgi:hypothetical protein